MADLGEMIDARVPRLRTYEPYKKQTWTRWASIGFPLASLYLQL